MQKVSVLLVLVLVHACGDGAPSIDDAASSADGPTCSADCIEARWWVSRSSDCSAICSANPSYPECSQTDCSVGDARRFDGTSVKSLSPLVYSDMARSFQLLGSVTTETYVIDSDCMLRVGSRPAMTLTCGETELRFSTGVLREASSAQALGLDAALAAGAPGRYTY